MAIAQFPRIQQQATSSTIMKADFLKASQQTAHHFLHPNEHDVLSGRGGFVNAHPGNVRFRALVHERKTEYSLESNKERKNEICRQVIAAVHHNGGHFLAKEHGSNYWTCMSDDRIVAKTNQALREGAPKIREAYSSTSRKQQQRGGKRSFVSTTTQSNATPATVASTTVFDEQPPFEEQQPFFVPIIEPSPEFRPVEEPNTSTMMEWDVDPDFRGTTVSPTHESYNDYDATALTRRHSLVLSDISPHPNYLEADFENPFANEEFLLDAGMGSLLANASATTLQRGVSSTLPMEFLSI